MKPKPKITRSSVQKILQHHFGRKPERVAPLEGGLENHVFEGRVRGEDYVVRISDDPAKLSVFQKEQWVAALVRRRNIPAPVILEVSHQAIGFPYMISRKMVGQSGLEAVDRLEVIRQMGKLAGQINRIPTRGFGQMFEWSANQLSTCATWKDFLRKEFNAPHRLRLLEHRHFLSPSTAAGLRCILRSLEKSRKPGTLTHGDLRLKNILLNPSGGIAAILDWEHSISSIGPGWEFSIALHDLAIDEKQAFLEGYGLARKEFEEAARVAKFFNILNYAPVVERALERRDKEAIEGFRQRLRGQLDLFSL